MLKNIIDNNLVEARAIVGFYPSNSNEDDDIEVMDPNDQSKIITKFATLRQ